MFILFVGLYCHVASSQQQDREYDPDPDVCDLCHQAIHRSRMMLARYP